VQKQTGKAPEKLQGPPLSLEVAYLWDAFINLSLGRQQGFNGPQPISYSEINSWMQATKQPLDAREVDALKALDAIFIRTMTNNG
jgi:hypothetical protein